MGNGAAWTADTVIASAIDACGHVLTRYQQAFLNDPAPFRAPRGRARASVYLDELAFYPHSGAVYTGALPIVTHGGRITVASTPNSDRGMFWRIVSDLELALRFSQHSVPWWRAPWLCRDGLLAAAWRPSLAPASAGGPFRAEAAPPVCLQSPGTLLS